MSYRGFALAVAICGLSIAAAAGEGDSPPRAGKSAEKNPAAQPLEPSTPIPIGLDSGENSEAFWNEYFSSRKERDAAPPAAVREAIRQLMRKREFKGAIALIGAALRHRHGQPWMFEALGLAMQAAGRPQAEIERALMSALDFTNRPGDRLYLAYYLARAGMHQRALQLFRQVGDLDPRSPEAFAYAMRLAQRLDDQPSLEWATLGILSQSWPQRHARLKQDAFNLATSTLDRLRGEGRRRDAEAFQAKLDEVVVRDCVVVVSWLGEADIDLLVEEPSGTVCSHSNPRTSAGGTLLGDDLGPSGARQSRPSSEVYVCAKGFDGVYRIHVRRAWGNPAADKVTLDVHWHAFSKQCRTQQKQIELVDGEAWASFELHDGRRDEPLGEQQAADAVEAQLGRQRQDLVRQLNQLHDQRAAGAFHAGGNPAAPQNPLAASAVDPAAWLGANQALGYAPVLLWLTKGSQMQNAVAISPDRRFTRVATTTAFSGVPSENEFNSATGLLPNTNREIGFWGYYEKGIGNPY